MRDGFFEPAPPPERDAPDGGIWKKLGWFALLAMAGVLATGALAYGLRALLFIG
ncbi:MAG: DUF2474 domain-containing protein [Pseudomonadota bacterium]